MAIYNSNGTVYKLQGPNPMMKKQKIWDEKGEFKLHNCSWETEVLDDNLPQPVPTKSDFTIKEEPEPEAKPETKPEMEINVVDRHEDDDMPEITIVERNAPTQPPERTVRKLDGKVVMHCLQATATTTRDDFYDESRPKVEYDKTFNFEAIIASQNDINMMFWTNIKIPERSVVYPQNQEKRWWEIIDVQERGGGYLHVTMPSTVNPSFAEK